jgi:signal transduction histidine kinase
MQIETESESAQTVLKLLNEARVEADTLRARLGIMNRMIQSSRLLMGHELKKPTTAICGYLDLALEDLEERDVTELETVLRKARRECELLIELNEFFLELLKIDSKEEVLHGVNVDLRQAVIETLGELPTELDAGTRVRTRISPNVQNFCIGRDAFKLMVSNIVENALKYSPTDSDVLLDLRRTQEKRGMRGQELLRLKVSDHGVGIPERELQRVFAPFVRLNESVSEGLGLGLTLVKSLVELYGGDVYVKSAKGEGTTVYVTLPETESKARSEDQA